jgi:beta-glucosidase
MKRRLLGASALAWSLAATVAAAPLTPSMQEAQALSTVLADGRRVVDTGPVQLWVGGGQPMAAATGARAAGQMLKLQVTAHAELPAFGPTVMNLETRE